MKFIKKNKFNLKVAALFLITIILMTDIIPFLKADSNETLPRYLFLRHPVNMGYHNFTAKGECYLYAEIDNMDYITVKLDGEDYVLSYGINIFPVEFSESFVKHTLLLPDTSSTCIKSLAIEPLYLANGTVETSLDEGTDILFEAGGLVSLLLQPNFSYNWLYLEVDEIIYKKIYDTDNYPEIDSQFYSYFVDQGAYCRFDLNLYPGVHHLKLKGNGSINYKIVVNSDWDEDQLSDVDEIQKQDFFDLDPVVPDVWGFFQKSTGQVYWNNTEDPTIGKKEGFFNFYIPQSGVYDLAIDIYNGEFSEFNIDGNASIIENTLTANYPNTSINSKSISIKEGGWHYVQYYFTPGFNRISFRLNSIEIKLISQPELIDSDGDGLKDVEEEIGEDKIHLEDTDKDGLPDPFDSSPDSSLTLYKDNITQLLIPTSIDKNSIITIQVKRPENDYSTNGVPRFWRDEINVSITAVLRLFGNQYQFNEDSPIKPLSKGDLTYLWGKEITTYSLVNDDPDIGDALPPPSNPNNETVIIHPIPTEKCFEYQIKFPKNHSAKSDGILDLRFDIVWLVTSYTVENGTQLLHYYDLEEDLTIQTIIHREIADLYYTIGTPDDFVENQVLWALTQNREIGPPDKYNVSQDIIGQGNVDYFAIGEAILNDVDIYYRNNEIQNNETQVLYFAGLYETRDILSDITAKYDPESGPAFIDTIFQQYLSFYCINDVYDDYRYGEEQLEGNSKLIFQTYLNNFTLLLGMPVYMEVKVFPNTKVLIIKEVFSELIPNEDIPYSIDSTLSDNIILQNKTYIIQKRIDEPVPTLHFIHERDEYKEITDNRANQVESGKIFFENSSYWSSKFTVYHYYMNALNRTLGDLHQELRYFHSEEGQQQYGTKFYDIFRDFSDFLDIYVDTRGSYFINLKNIDTSKKLESLDKIRVEMISFFSGISLSLAILKLSAIEGVYSNFKVVNNWFTKLKNGVTKIPSGIKNFGKKIWKITPQKLKNCLLKIKNKLFKGDGLGWKGWVGVGKVGIATVYLGYHISEILTLSKEAEAGKYSNNTLMFFNQLILSITAIVMDSVLIFSGVIDILKAKGGEFITKHFDKATKFLSYITIAISIATLIIDWYFFIQDVLGGKFQGPEFVIKLTMLIYETLIIIGLTICVLTKETGIGALLGGIFAGLAFLSSLLAPYINSVNFYTLPNSGFVIPDETKLNWRRHGSFEQGDILGFRLAGLIWGENWVWVKSRFRLEGDDWIGDWTGYKGKWYGLDKYMPKAVYIAYFTREILAPTTDIKYSLNFALDFDQLVIILPIFFWIRTVGTRQTINDSLGMPALENTISEFYDNTTEIVNTEQLKQYYQLALEEYRYKDAYDIATEIIVQTEGQAEVVPSELEEIIDHKQEYNQTHFKLTTQNANEFLELIDKHFDEGFRAETLIPESERGSLSSDEIKYLHMISYEHSNGIIVFPKEWIYNKLEELGDAYLYEQYRSELPLKTNIFLDLEGKILDIDPISGKVDVDLTFLLEGPDNPLVNITFETPNGFMVSPGMLTQHLKSNFVFTLEDKDHILYAGLYMLNLTVYMGDILIYRKEIPFIIQAYSDLTLDINIPDDPINPGEILNLVNVTNRGTIEEFIELKIEGIPYDFIYKDLYPEPYNNSIQYFTISQGVTRQCLVINPPRCFTSIPGEYIYIITLKNALTNETVHVYQGSFVVAEFYELDFQCHNPIISILDNETCTYNFTITNLGNVEDEFIITYTDIEIALSYLDEDTFLLAPGQSQSFEIMLDPLKIGSQVFIITVASEHISKILVASITISDDDIDPPILSDLLIEDDIHRVYISLKAWDQSGIDYFRIYVDGVLIEPQKETQNGDYYSFILENEWILLHGIHEVDIYVTDADNDRAFDNLTSSISGTFTITLDQMYEYVDWQIETLKIFIEENTCCKVSQYLNKKLSQAQYYLSKAFNYIEVGKITLGLYKDCLAKTCLKSVESKTEIYNKITWIDDYTADFIIKDLHEIRNNIVIIKGTSTYTEIGYDIALIEIELLNLFDFIEQVICWGHRELLSNLIRVAAEKLELTIIKISMGINPKPFLTSAQWKLEYAICEVNQLLNKGKISQELADTLLGKINQIYLDIEDVKNSI